jgi:hypothetical protein
MDACKTCGGSRWVKKEISVPDGNQLRLHIIDVPCPDCNKSGNDGDGDGGKDDDDRGVIIIQL